MESGIILIVTLGLASWVGISLLRHRGQDKKIEKLLNDFRSLNRQYSEKLSELERLITKEDFSETSFSEEPKGLEYEQEETLDPGNYFNVYSQIMGDEWSHIWPPNQMISWHQVSPFSPYETYLRIKHGGSSIKECSHNLWRVECVKSSLRVPTKLTGQFLISGKPARVDPNFEEKEYIGPHYSIA